MNADIKIGISAKFHDNAPAFYGEAKRHIQYIETSVATWIAKNNALPLMIPCESMDSDLGARTLEASSYAQELDALILQGGVDIHPSIYKRAPAVSQYSTDIVRDQYELALIKAFIENRKPIFGICRGMQLINVHFGGTLISDLERQGYSKHFDKLYEHEFSHDVEIMDGGLFSRLGIANAKAISVHHQGIDLLGEGLFIEARSASDSLIEAISAISDQMFIVGVQWHPEFQNQREIDFFDSSKLLRMFTRVAYNRKFYGDLGLERKRPVKFSKSSLLTLGTELELQIIDPVSLDLVPMAPKLIASMSKETDKVKSEIFQSMIEVETGICQDAIETEADLLETCKALVLCAQKNSLLIGSTGIHPFAKYSDRKVTPNDRYKNLIISKQWIASRITIFGLHCHVGVQSPEQGIDLYRFYLSIAPLLLGISASSPFFEAEKTGLHSVRSTFFESTPSGGHPPILTNWMEFQGLMSKLLKCEAISSHKDLWWDVRPSLNYGTIEVRICDSLPTVKENAALVALIHLLGYAYLTNKEYTGWPHLSDWSYRENKWRALRYGIDFDFVFDEEGNSRPAKEILDMMLEDFKDLINDLGYSSFMQILKDKMLLEGSAKRQIETFNRTSDLKKVVEEYCLEFSRSIFD